MAETQIAETIAGKTEIVEQKTTGKDVAVGSLRLRLPYPRSVGEYAGVDVRQWQVLIDTVWPSAKTVEAVCMAIAYCRARGLDPLKKVVHIVPMWSSVLSKMVETVWPGIAEIRITATRTGAYAGKDATVFGPDVEETFTHVHEGKTSEKSVIFPEWAQVTVYRMVQGQRCAFVGPKVFWMEAYATENRFSTVPNEMWATRESGQLEKCAEAGALRAAFPEELGNEYTAEEMWGRTTAAPLQHAIVIEDGVATPPASNGNAAFKRDASKDPKPREKKASKKKSSPAGATPPGPNEDPKDTAPGPKGGDGNPPSGGAGQKKDPETPFQRGVRLLAGIKAVKDVADLRKSIAAEIDDAEIYQDWERACDVRSKEILEGAANG